MAEPQNSRLLLIEDAFLLPMDYERQLQQAGFTVKSVATHSQAEKLLATDRHFAAIISDGWTDNPPHPDTTSDVAAFLEKNLHGEIPVLVISGDDKVHDEARAAGCRVFGKPLANMKPVIAALGELGIQPSSRIAGSVSRGAAR